MAPLHPPLAQPLRRSACPLVFLARAQALCRSACPVALLFLSFSLIAALLPACGSPPPPPPQGQEAVPLHPVDGPGWRVEIPADWTEREPGLFIGPDRAHLLVTSKDNPASLTDLRLLNLLDLARAHPDFEVIAERLGRVADLPAHEITGRYTSPAGQPVVQITVLVDAGATKHVLTLASRADDFSNHDRIFQRVVGSFRVSRPGDVGSFRVGRPGER